VNLLLPSVYDELFHRLAVGIEPLDAVRGTGVPVPLNVHRDRGSLDTNRLEALRRRRLNVYDVMESVTRHPSRVHVILWTKQESGNLVVRLLDPLERYVPRRLRIPVSGLPASDPASLDVLTIGQRTRRPMLYPGAAYPVSGGVTGFRGCLVFPAASAADMAVPVRWARIQAWRSGALVGAAHSDHRGEFLLPLSPDAVHDSDLPRPLEIEVRVFSPAAPPPAPSPDWLAEVDPHWDLPLETLAAPGVTPDPVADGTALPDGYALRITRTVTLTYGSFATSGPTPLEVT
jgi:hypothetical protein